MKKYLALISAFCITLASICYADQKTSQMPIASTLTGAELIPVVQGSVNKAAPASLFMNLNTTGTAGGLTGSPNITVGTLAATGHGSTGDGFHVTGTGVPAAGASVELTYNSGTDTGYMLAYDRTTSSYKSLSFNNAATIGPTGIATAPSFVGPLTGNASTATNLSGTPALPNGTTATTQAVTDSSTKLATNAFVANAIQSNSFNFGVDTGTANAYAVTISPTPALIPGTSGPTGSFQALHGNTGASTLSINGGTPIPIVRATGGTIQALVGLEIQAGQMVQLAYDGTSFQMQTPSAAAASGTSSNTAIRGSYSNLKASATGTSATTTVTADEIILENSSNNYQTLRAVSLSIAGTSVGANGLDTGSLAANTWYSTWVIWNGTTTSGLMSLSATAPTMPSGYTYKARTGWIRTDGTANKYPLSFTQSGRRVQYKVAAGSNVVALPIMSSGTQGSTTVPTWVAVSTGAFVPATASIVRLVIFLNNGTLIVAPNNAYGAYNSATNPPPATLSFATLTGFAYESVLESSNIYTAATAGLVQCYGWEDNL